MPYQKFDHEFLKTPPLSAVRVLTADEARPLIQRQPNIILWLDIHQSRDRQLVVIPTGQLEKALTPQTLGDKWRGGAILHRYDLSEVRPLIPQAPLLQDMLKAFPDQRVILNVAANVEGVDLLLTEAVKDFSPQKRLLIQSDTDVILRSLKDLHPMWLYGTSWADITKLLSFDSIGLGPAIEFKGDVFIVPPRINGRPAYTDSIVTEMHRRLKSVFIGPLQNADDFAKAREAKADGLIFATPELWREIEGVPASPAR
ncbi:MAG: hypothetical protein KF865_09225 [Bdellovibrionaceae bacterium]|nr:hypothetical protein [Pseudobdellovibrionaceae bacterium]